MGDDRCDLLCLDLPHAEAVRTSVAGAVGLEQAVVTAQALGDPTRLRIAVALAEGTELCVCDLAWVCRLAQNLVSHHVRRLRDAGLATSQRHRRLVMYRLTADGAVLLSALRAPLAGRAPATALDSARSGDAGPGSLATGVEGH